MKNNNKKLKQFPVLQSDKDTEDFVNKADLSEYDLSGFQQGYFEFKPKSKTVSLRLSDGLYNAAKQVASRRGLKTQQFMRQALEDAVAL